MSSAERTPQASGTWLGLPVYWEEAPGFPLTTSQFMMAGAIVFLAVMFVVAPDQLGTARGVGPAFLALTGLAARLMVWRGKVRAASFTLICGAWIYVSVVSYTTGGLRANPIFIYPLIIMTAGWRLGPAFGHLLAGLTILVCLGFFAAETGGVLPPPLPNPAVLPLVVQVFGIAFSSVMVTSLVRTYRERLDGERRLSEQLAASHAEVQAREADLNEAQKVARIGSWSFDVASDTARLSAEACRIFDAPDGYEITQPELLRHVHEDDRASLTQAWRNACTDKVAFNLDYRIATRDTLRWVRQIARVEFAQDGRPLRALGTVQDITERKQLDAELDIHQRHLEDLVRLRTDELLATEARASLILQSSADGLYGVDAHGLITFINPAACRILGYEGGQVTGRSAHELFHHTRADGSPYPAAECPGRLSVREGQSIRIDDEVFWRADGHPIPVMYASHPMIEKGEVTGAVISFVDMSVQHAAAAAREQALIAAENLARTRSEFLANMSHEIRTPMNGVLGFAQIGLRSHLDGDKARNAFEKILASGNQLLGVVNEILDFSRIDAGKLPIEAIEMSLLEVIDHALDSIADRARAKGLELRLEIAPGLPTRCIGDPTRLGQVLLNLLTNAVKFTEKGRIDLSASRRNGELVFSVADTGIGMTEDQLAFIFNPFHQADSSTTRKFGGTGLGLAISKRLAELMHGEIRVESRPGTGSRFELSVPYVEPEPHAAEGAAARPALPEKPLAGISILVAEDDKVNQLMLEANLVEDGARLAMVGNGREAVDRIVADGPGAYDIVLMDLQMPVMDGYEATRRILELAPGLPVVGQTAHALDEDRERCLAAGMVDHVAKPIDAAALAQLVRRIVTARRRKAA